MKTVITWAILGFTVLGALKLVWEMFYEGPFPDWLFVISAVWAGVEVLLKAAKVRL